MIKCILFHIQIAKDLFLFFDDGTYTSDGWKTKNEIPQWKIEDNEFYCLHSRVGNKWTRDNIIGKQLVKQYKTTIDEIMEKDLLNE